MKRVLLVEDDTALITGLVYALEQEGMQIDVAKTVQMGRERLAAQTYDLVLLDMMLPDGNGLDLCTQIRQNSSVPIIFLTANDEEYHIIMGLDKGADDYITKPFRIRELISRINAVMRRGSVSQTEQDAATALVSGHICLNTLSMQLRVDGQNVPISALEYRLLLMFMQNPGRVLTRQQLLARLWDDQSQYVEDNTLSVNVRRLREKIGDSAPDAPIIKTIRGMGYLWDRQVQP